MTICAPREFNDAAFFQTTRTSKYKFKGLRIHSSLCPSSDLADSLLISEEPTYITPQTPRRPHPGMG